MAAYIPPSAYLPKHSLLRSSDYSVSSEGSLTSQKSTIHKILKLVLRCFQQLMLLFTRFRDHYILRQQPLFSASTPAPHYSTEEANTVSDQLTDVVLDREAPRAEQLGGSIRSIEQKELKEALTLMIQLPHLYANGGQNPREEAILTKTERVDDHTLRLRDKTIHPWRITVDTKRKVGVIHWKDTLASPRIEGAFKQFKPDVLVFRVCPKTKEWVYEHRWALLKPKLSPLDRFIPPETLDREYKKGTPFLFHPHIAASLAPLALGDRRSAFAPNRTALITPRYKTNLEKRIWALGPIPKPLRDKFHELFEILHGAAKGVQALHKKNIVHLDIKPDNIFVEHNEGEKSVGIVGDLGLSEKVGNLTRGGAPLYRAPELNRDDGVMGKATLAHDLYSFGTLIKEATTDLLFSQRRRRAFDRELDETLETILFLATQLRSAQPSDRPTMDKVVQTFQKALLSLYSSSDNDSCDYDAIH